MTRRRALALFVAAAAWAAVQVHPAAGATIYGRTLAHEPDSLLPAQPGHCPEGVVRFFVPERLLVLHVRGWSDARPERFAFDSTVVAGDAFSVFHGKPDPEPWTYEAWTTDPSGNASCTRRTLHGEWAVSVPVAPRVAYTRDYDVSGAVFRGDAMAVRMRASYDSTGRRIGARKLVIVR